MHHAHVRVRRYELVGQAARAVGGVVVDDENVGVGERIANLSHDPRQIVSFVVGGGDDQRAAHGGARETTRKRSGKQSTAAIQSLHGFLDRRILGADGGRRRFTLPQREPSSGRGKVASDGAGGRHW